MKAEYLFVSFIESCREGDHDISLFDQELLVTIDLCFVSIHTFSLFLQLFQFRLVFLCREGAESLGFCV